MEFSIESRKFGKTVTFSIPGTSYIYCDMGIPGNHGTLGDQICHGGDLVGSTMSYHGDDEDEFEKICRNWWKSYLRNRNERI